MRYKNRLMRVDAALSRELAKAESRELDWLGLLSVEEQDALLAALKEFEASQTPEAMERARALDKKLHAVALRRQSSGKTGRDLGTSREPIVLPAGTTSGVARIKEGVTIIRSGHPPIVIRRHAPVV